MLKVERFEHPQFTSNTYLLRHSFYNEVYLVDAGYILPIFDCLLPKQIIKGVFITHPHYDHIYDINRLMNSFPECKIFCSQETRRGLQSEKENLSFYHEKPVSYHGENIVTLQDGDRVHLFSQSYIEVIATPGHHPGCLSFLTENYIFTGDSFIPAYDVVTKLKGGSKIASQNSVKKIQKILVAGKFLCPGHFDVVEV